MKNRKTIKPFFFKDKTHQEVLNILNKEYPVSIRYNEDLVNRVHARYPFVDKAQVSIVIKGIFQSMRDLLVLGNILNFHGLFFDTKLHFYYFKKSAIRERVKVKMRTSPKLRKLVK